MIELSIWDYSNVVTKLFIYLGASAAIGGPFISTLIKPSNNKKKILNYILIFSLIGFIAVIFNFMIQIAAFSEIGFSGLFDIEMGHFLWQTPVGDSVLWRLIAFALLVVSLYLGDVNLRNKALTAKHLIFVILYIAAVIAFAYSFSLIGHSTESGRLAKWLLGFHIIAVLLWMGALYPLWISCKLLPSLALYRLMHLFGLIAAVIVGVLVACGIGLLFLFLNSPLELLNTEYGRAILAKIVLVSLILLIAAHHKFVLVGQLNEEGGVLKLQRSIKKEMWIGLIILSLTAWLSTAVGPLSVG